MAVKGYFENNFNLQPVRVKLKYTDNSLSEPILDEYYKYLVNQFKEQKPRYIILRN